MATQPRDFTSRVTLAIAISYAGFVFALVGNVVIARLLGVEGRGAFSLFLATVSGLSVFSGLGTGHGQMFYASREPSKLAHFMPNGLLLSFLLGGGAALSYFAIGRYFDFKIVAELGPAGAIAAVLLVPAISAMAFQRQYLLTIGRYALSKVNASVAQTAPLIAVVLAYAAGEISVKNLVIALVSVHALFFVVFQYRLARLPENAARLSGSALSLAFAKESLEFGYRQYLSDLALFLANRLDFFLVTWFLGKSGLGIYAVAVALAEVVARLPSELGTILFPAFASGEVRGPGAAAILRRSLLLAVVIASALAVVSGLLVPLLYGDAFREAIAPFRWLLLGTIAWSTIYVTWNHASAGGRPGIGVPIFGAAAALGAVLNALLLPRVGVVGGSIAATVNYWFAAALFLRLFCVREGCSLRQALVVQSDDVQWFVEQLRRLAEHLTSRISTPRDG